jgi:hypothetical protein
VTGPLRTGAARFPESLQGGAVIAEGLTEAVHFVLLREIDKVGNPGITKRGEFDPLLVGIRASGDKTGKQSARLNPIRAG